MIKKSLFYFGKNMSEAEVINLIVTSLKDNKVSENVISSILEKIHDKKYSVIVDLHKNLPKREMSTMMIKTLISEWDEDKKEKNEHINKIKQLLIVDPEYEILVNNCIQYINCFYNLKKDDYYIECVEESPELLDLVNKIVDIDLSPTVMYMKSFC